MRRENGEIVGNGRGMERRKLCGSVWMRKNEREEKFMEDERERVGEQPNFKIF